MTRHPAEAARARGHRHAARRITLIAALAFLVIGVLATFVDLPLSRAVVNPDSGWANFLADYGEVPGYLLAIASVALVVNARLFDSRRRPRPRGERGGAALLRAVGSVVWTALLAFLLVYGVARSVDFFAGGLDATVLLAVGIGGGAAVVALWRWASRETRVTLAEPARAVTVLAILNPILIVQLFKALWGRVRFRHLAADFSDFTAWFAPQGVTGHESFPSGHAAMGWMLLPIAFWVAWRLTRDGRTGVAAGVRVVVWAVTIGFGVAVAASRVVVGAHYLSDVAFSTAVAWVLTPWLVMAGGRASVDAGERAAKPRGLQVDPDPA